MGVQSSRIWLFRIINNEHFTAAENKDLHKIKITNQT